MNSLIVDCGSCGVRGAACSDCVITVLLGETGGAPARADELHEFNEEEQAAVAALALSGLVPPLRLVGGGHRTPVAGSAVAEGSAASGL